MATDDDEKYSADDAATLSRRRRRALIAAAKRAWLYTAVLDGLPADELEELENLASYQISDDGRSITCATCGLTSHNPNDVEQAYCGNCHRFHRDENHLAKLFRDAASWFAKSG